MCCNTCHKHINDNNNINNHMKINIIITMILYQKFKILLNCNYILNHYLQCIIAIARTSIFVQHNNTNASMQYINAIEIRKQCCNTHN